MSRLKLAVMFTWYRLLLSTVATKKLTLSRKADSG
jgi:hypothetical protein